MSQDQLDARRKEILTGARTCFARHGYEGATVRRLEEEIGLSRGAIFHHFRDKDSLFLAVAEDDAATMVATVARTAWCRSCATCSPAATGTPGHRQPGGRGRRRRVARQPARGVAAAAHRPRVREAVGGPVRGGRRATRERLQRQREAGVLRADVLGVLAQFLELAYDGLVLHLATGRPRRPRAVLDLVEAAVRRT